MSVWIVMYAMCCVLVLVLCHAEFIILTLLASMAFYWHYRVSISSTQRSHVSLASLCSLWLSLLA
jgi:hypothetical protein